MAEPSVRFLQLCGIALVISEVTGDGEVFAPFDSLWTVLMADAEQSTQLLGWAAATLASEGALFAITPGGIDRSNIEIQANGALEDLGVPRGLYDMGGLCGFGDHEDMVVPEAAARLLRAVRSSHFEGMFYARWLRPKAIAAGASLPSDVEQQLQLLDLDGLGGVDE